MRAEILEDVELARRVKRAGGRLVFLPGAKWVRTRMYRSFGDMWHGWSKNLYLLYGRNLWAVLKAFAEVWVLDFLFPVGLVALCILIVAGGGSSTALLVAVLGSAFVVIRRWAYRRQLVRLGFDPDVAKYQVPGAGLWGVLLLNSACAHRLTGEVRWKGRHYPTKGQ